MRAAAVLAFVASVGAVGSCGSDDEAECTLTDCDGSCVEGTTECGGVCVDTALDPAHCGACDSPCAAGELCSGGSCGLQCTGGTTLCGELCVDTNVDTAHCGDCDAPCEPGEVCVAGQCGLPALSFGSVSPDRAYYPGGGTVIIQGNVFGTTTVTIGGRACADVTLLSGTELTCVVPSGVVGTADVVLSNGASETATGADAFTYLDFTTVTTIVGTGTAGATDGAGDVAQVSGAVNGLSIDGDTLVVADGTNYAIRTVDLSQLDPTNVQASDVTVATLAGGTMGIDDSTDGTGATAQFRQPDDPGVNIAGKLYVSDSEWAALSFPTALRTVDLTSGDTQTFSASMAYHGYAALAWDGGPYLYVSECSSNNTIRRVELANANIIELVGTVGVFGDVDGVGAAAQIDCPYGLAFDATGNSLYFVDWGNDKLKRVEISTRLVTTIAGTGTAGYADEAVGHLAQFDSPAKMVVAGDYAFVAELNNCTVRQVDLTTTAVTTIAGSPSNCDAAVVDGAVASATLASPGGIAYHPQLGIFVGSTNWGWRTEPVSHRIRLIH